MSKKKRFLWYKYETISACVAIIRDVVSMAKVREICVTKI